MVNSKFRFHFSLPRFERNGGDNMCKKTLMTLAVLVLGSLTAFAASKDDGFVWSKDGRKVFATEGATKPTTRYVSEGAGLTTIYDNLAPDYPDGVYWSDSGLSIAGGSAPYGIPQYWNAASFTPSTSLNVTQIQVALSWVPIGETDSVVILSLNADNGGIPGAVLEEWKVPVGGLTLGGCCGVATKYSPGIPVTAGTQYWVLVSTSEKSDVVAAWNFNVTQQLSTNAIPNAFWCSSPIDGACGPSGNGWELNASYPPVAFAVFGK
jgi:hypothetical protein